MIRASAVAFLWLGMSFTISAQSELELKVILSKPKVGGIVQVAFCGSEGSFANNKGCVTTNVEALSDTVVLRTVWLPTGLHAIKVFHDIDRNGELNTNWLGIPIEPYGFSNDARGLTGPPSFEMAAFLISEGKNTHMLRLK